MLTVRICVGALMSEKVEDSDVRLYNTRSSTRREPPLEENECGGVVRDLVPSGGARHPRILLCCFYLRRLGLHFVFAQSILVRIQTKKIP